MSAQQHDFHLVNPSPWPIIGAFSAMTMLLGLVFAMHGFKPAGIPLNVITPLLGFIMVLVTMYNWWKNTIHEGIVDKAHTSVVRHGMRMGMALFILSEVMFFFAFFWAFFKAALSPALVFEGSHVLENLATLKSNMWPPEGITPFDAWDLPLMNTLILLLSGCTVTWAHYALLHNDRKNLIKGLACTVALGVLFTVLQAVEYAHATFCMSGLFNDLVHHLGFHHAESDCTVSPAHVYPSSFFMATGFHGAHVIIGTTFLSVCLYRAIKGQMTPEGHLGFEFAAWYWHFVDVVWLFLFACVYVWGS